MALRTFVSGFFGRVFGNDGSPGETIEGRAMRLFGGVVQETVGTLLDAPITIFTTLD